MLPELVQRYAKAGFDVSDGIPTVRPFLDLHSATAAFDRNMLYSVFASCLDSGARWAIEARQRAKLQNFALSLGHTHQVPAISTDQAQKLVCAWRKANPEISEWIKEQKPTMILYIFENAGQWVWERITTRGPHNNYHQYSVISHATRMLAFQDACVETGLDPITTQPVFARPAGSWFGNQPKPAPTYKYWATPYVFALDPGYNCRCVAVPQAPEPEPGTIIAWQQAQDRVDRGLPVETPLEEWANTKSWRLLSDPAIQLLSPRDQQNWTYRVPLAAKAPQAPAPEMQSLKDIRISGLTEQLATERAAREAAEAKSKELCTELARRNYKVERLETSQAALLDDLVAVRGDRDMWQKEALELRVKLAQKEPTAPWKQVNAWHEWAGKLLGMTDDATKRTTASYKQEEISGLLQRIRSVRDSVIAQNNELTAKLESVRKASS
jgi:hypothetical protein